MKNLVLASVGDYSRHPLWLQGEQVRNFDLWLVYYGDVGNRYAHDGERYLGRKGGKWHNIHALTQGADLSCYDYIFTPDDDLQMSGDSINLLFEKAQDFELDLAQPAFTWDSLARWKITVLRPFMTLRWTNFVENGAALFSHRAFQACRHTFKESLSGFGLDLWWPLILGYPKRAIGILDAVPCRHSGEASELDSLLPREDHRLEGDRLLKGLQLQAVREYDFELNRNGREMLAGGRSREQIRKLAELYLLRIRS